MVFFLLLLVFLCVFFFFFKQKTAYEMRISDWSSDVCSSDLGDAVRWTVSPALLRTRAAAEMELCSNAIPLRLEDDGPTEGVRRIHWVDIMKPCWIWKDAPLEGATRITAGGGPMPFNFSNGDDGNTKHHENTTNLEWATNRANSA